MANFSDWVIDQLGGTMQVSRETGIPKGQVAGWRKRGIPPKRWSPVVRLASRKGKGKKITFEALAREYGAETRP